MARRRRGLMTGRSRFLDRLAVVGALVPGLAATGLATTGLATTAEAAAGYIRVSQIGYEIGQPMRAYLMSSAAVSGVGFTVKDVGGTVFATGVIGAKRGDWGAYSVYPIDFKISNAGAYRVSVSGAVVATSPEFPVGTPAALYTATKSVV